MTLALVVVGALSMSLLLVPTSAELGSHLFSDKEGGKARVYLERALVERGYQGDVVLPLAKIYSEQGEHAAALRLLQYLEPARASEAEREMRRQELRGSGRLFEYAQELEALRRDHPTAEVLADLAQAYAEQQLLELQADVLDDLLELRPNDAVVVRTAAHLDMQIGRKNRALELLDGLWRQQPAAVTPADFALLVALLIELDPSDTARDLVQAHLGELGAGLDLVDVAQLYLTAGRFQDARRLIEPLVASVDAEPRVLETWARTLIALGDAQTAVRTLRDRVGHAQFGRVTTMLCEVALTQGDLHEALWIAQQAHLRGIDERVLLWLANSAASFKERTILRALLAQLSDRALAIDPVGAANLHWIAGLREKALHWASRARHAETLAAPQRLWLAELYLGMGRPADAAAVLEQYGKSLKSVASGADDALRLATLWWRTGAHAKALVELDLLGQPRSVGKQAGRALLLAAAGRVDEAQVLLDAPQLLNSLVREADARKTADPAPGQGRAAVRDWLQALAQTAIVQRKPSLAVYSYRSQLILRPGQRNVQLALMQVYLDLGQPLEALASLRSLPPPLQATELLAYRQVLLAAWRAQAPVKDELVRATTDYLQTADLQTAEAQSWLHLLLDLGAGRAALPHVAKLAASEGGAWALRRIDLLKSLGDTGEVLALWRAQGRDERKTTRERLDAANSLLLAGDRASAVEIYQQVADIEAPDSDTVKQLLHLWGPRPGPVPVEWLAARARKSTGAAQVSWLRHLLWVGAADRVLALLADVHGMPLDPPEGPLLELNVDALVLTQSFKVLASLTERRGAGIADVATVKRLAEQCAAHGQKRAAEVAYVRLVELAPGDALALHYLAQTTAGTPARSLRYWQAWFALPATSRQPTWRDHVTYGDLLLADAGRRIEGKQQQQIALRLLATEPMPEHERHRESGRLLLRLGRGPEAIPLLERALAGHVCDDALRADLVAALMAAQQLDKARQLVDPPAECHANKK